MSLENMLNKNILKSSWISNSPNEYFNFKVISKQTMKNQTENLLHRLAPNEIKVHYYKNSLNEIAMQIEFYAKKREKKNQIRLKSGDRDEGKH